MAGGTETVTVVVADAVNGDETTVDVFTSAIEALDAAVALNHRGVARVGVAVGEAPRDRTNWSGPAIDEARRLRDGAPPGTVFVADLVRHLLGSRRSVVLQPAAIEGVWVWSPPEVGTGIPMPPGLANAIRGTTFVARAQELARLRGAWERAVTGAQQAVAIGGEPGIGKTRLASELALVVGAAGGVVLHGRADEDLAVPYKPFIEALTHYVRHVKPAALRRQLGLEGRELFRLLPGLAERLHDLGAPTRGEPEAERFLLFEAVCAFVARMAADAPVLLVLDDVHWADKPTLLLMQQLAARPARLLVVFTYRDTEVGSRHPIAGVIAALRRDNVVDRVALSPIGSADMAGFAASFPDLESDAGFWARLHDQTGGNPFFIEEVLRHATDVGATDAGVPEGVHEIVDRRLARLSDDATRVLTVAAVCGLEFDTEAVRAGTDLAEEAVLDGLDEAGAAGVIGEVAGAPGRWSFGHALVRQSIYEGLSAGRRVRLHWRIGEALASRPGASAIEVANHLVAGEVAGDGRRAALACLEAADEARQLAGFEAVVIHANRALAVLDDTGLRDDELEYRANMMRADALYGSADIIGSVAAYRRAAELARGFDDPARFADAVLGFTGPIRIEPDSAVNPFIDEALAAVGPEPGPHRIKLLAQLIDSTIAWIGRGPLRAAFDEMMSAAARIDDPNARAAVAQAECRYWQGSPNIDAIANAATRSLEMPQPAADGRYMSTRNFMASRIDLAYAAVATGNREAFDASLADSDENASRRGLRFPLWNAAVFRAAATIAEGRLEAAREQVTAARDMVPVATGGFSASYRAQMTAIRIAEGAIDGLIARLPTFIARAHPSLGVPHRAMLAGLLARAGDLDAAQTELDTLAAADFADIADDWMRPLTLRWVAEACAAVADRRRAALLEPLVRPYSGLLWIQTYSTTIEGAADRSLAQVLTTLGRPEEAADLFAHGLELEEQMGFAGLAAVTRQWKESHLHTG